MGEAGQPRQVGDVVRAHGGSSSGMHCGTGSGYEVTVSSLLTTCQQLVHLIKDWHFGEHMCRTVMAILDKQVTPVYHLPSSWRQMEEPLTDFQRRYGHHNIPQDLLEKLWRALQRKTDKVYDSAVVCPTYAEYCSAIEHLPRDSAPGISGLSYNVLKIIPERLSKAMYGSMADIWEDKLIPDFWKWRWILPIPKEADPTLNDLCLLSLFETTRKVWFALILTKLRATWASDELLHPAQTMFIKGRSMDMSVISLLNVLETAREMKSDVFLSSWDITKAFDRVPIQTQVWAYIRLGVSIEVAEYMVAFDVDCVAVVRTPLACQAWQTGGYEGLRRHGYSPGVGMAQGNVDT